MCICGIFPKRAGSDTALDLRVTFSKGLNLFENQLDVVMEILAITQSQQNE